MIWPFDPLRPGCADLIAADPPWCWQSRGRNLRAPPYGLMSTADIAAMPVASLAAPDCVLLLWATGAMLRDAMAVLEAWGFAYKSLLSWRKMTRNGFVRYGTGYWALSGHEPVLIATRGRPRPMRFRSIFDGLAREHSRKPDEFFELVESRSPGARRVELFSRQSRPGWSAWGDESGKFDRLESAALAAAVARAVGGES